ncbi:MAG: C39 family peptidase [bacterium]
MKNELLSKSNGYFTKIVCLIAILAVGFSCLAFWKRQSFANKYEELTKPTPPAATEVTKEQVKERETAVKSGLPEKFNLDVPFIKQAPLGVWDATHEETCEEASVLTVHAYNQKLILTDSEVEVELLRLVEVQKKLFGFFEDTDVSKTIKFAKTAYEIKSSRVLENPTLEQIKYEIYAGRPVLMPADGKMLKNPNFRGGGPKYHLIVLRGWDKNGFFTNDPGTRKGENYYYVNKIIQESMHDWSEADQLATGPRRVFVLTE